MDRSIGKLNMINKRFDVLWIAIMRDRMVTTVSFMKKSFLMEREHLHSVQIARHYLRSALNTDSIGNRGG